MIEHVVLVEVPPSAEARRQEIIDMFTAFRDEIPGVIDASSGVDFSGRSEPYSVIAVLRMEDREALQGYASHPAHLKLIARLDELGCNRIVADFEGSSAL